MVEVIEIKYRLEGKTRFRGLKWGEVEEVIRKILGVCRTSIRGTEVIQWDLGSNHIITLDVEGINASNEGFVVYLSALKDDIDHFEGKKGYKFEKFLEELEEKLLDEVRKVDEYMYMHRLIQEVQKA